MNCDDIANYRVKILYREKEEATGVIVKLKEFPNNFFVFTAKHTFGNKIEPDEVSINYHGNRVSFKSFILLSLDIVIFIFDNSALSTIGKLDKIEISAKENNFEDSVFSGYPSNVDDAFCEKCKYHEQIKTEENLYRILPAV